MINALLERSKLTHNDIFVCLQCTTDASCFPSRAYDITSSSSSVNGLVLSASCSHPWTATATGTIKSLDISIVP